MAWNQTTYPPTDPYGTQYNPNVTYNQQAWPPQTSYDNSGSTGGWPPGYVPPTSDPNANYANTTTWSNYGNGTTLTTTTNYSAPTVTYTSSTTGAYSSPTSTLTTTYSSNPTYATSTSSPSPAPQYDPNWPPGMGPNAAFPTAPPGVAPVTVAPSTGAWPPPVSQTPPLTNPAYTASNPTSWPSVNVTTTAYNPPTASYSQMSTLAPAFPAAAVSTTPVYVNPALPQQPPTMPVLQPQISSPTSLLSPQPQPAMDRKMSRVQEALLLQMAEEEKRRQGLEEAALREREAQVKLAKTQVESVPLAGNSSGTSSAAEAEALAVQNAQRRREIERRRTQLFEEEQVVEALKRSAEDERLRREAQRRQQEAEAEALLREQQELQRKEREIAEKKRLAEESKRALEAVVQDAKSAEAKLLEAQRLRDQQAKDLERQKAEEEARRKEQAELQMSFYSSLVDASKLVAQNSNRLYNLVETQYSDIMQAGSPTASFFSDVKRLLDRTTQRLVSLLEDNVLNLESTLYDSISSATRDVRTSAQTYLSATEKLTSAAPESASLSQEERSTQLRHHNVALNFSIKSLLQELEALKVAESSSAESVGLMQAQSVKEATVIVDRQLEVQSARRDSVNYEAIAIQKQESIRRFRPTKPVTMTPQELARYDRPAVRSLQKSLKRFAIRSKMRNLVNIARTHPATQPVRHRNKLLREIVESESTYLQAVQTALQFFLPQMQAASQPGGPLQVKDVQAIFGSLDLIHALNSEILEKMRNRIKSWPQNQLFGDIFIEYAPRLQVYTDYVNNFDSASEILKRLSQNKAFVELMKSCMEKARSRLDLPSLLIQPVQRLPRYQLLLKELIKLSDESHVDRKNLAEALQKITSVNVGINKRKKELDNNAKINAIRAEINGLDADLLIPNRLFIRSGSVSFSSARAKGTSYAQVYFFNDVFIVAKMLKKDSPPPFEFQERIDMAKIEVQDLDKKTIKLFDGSSEKLKLEWSLEFDSEDVKKAWLKDIRESLETTQLRSLLDDNIQKTNLIKEGLLILSATFGVLSDPKRCIDVTQALQQVVKQSGGNLLVLPAGPKSSLPGFINPARHKSKQLMIVYSAKGAVRTKTWGEKEEVKINLNVS